MKSHSVSDTLTEAIRRANSQGRLGESLSMPTTCSSAKAEKLCSDVYAKRIIEILKARVK